MKYSEWHTNQKVWLICEAVIIICVLTNFLTQLLIDKVNTAGLIPDTVIIMRCMLFLLLVIFIFITMAIIGNKKLYFPTFSLYLLKNINISSSIKVKFTVFICFLIIFSIAYIFPFVVLLSLIACYTYLIFHNYSESLCVLLNNKKTFYFLVLFGLVPVVTPLAVSQYINSESYPTIKQSNNIVEHLRRTDQLVHNNPTYQIQITSNDIKNIRVNERIMRHARSDTQFALYNLHHADQTIKFIFLKNNIHSLCLLGDYSGMSRPGAMVSGSVSVFTDPILCMNIFRAKSPSFALASKLSEIPFSSMETRDRVYNFFEGINFSEIKRFQNSNSDQVDVTRYAGIVGNKGLYFHHYNAIGQTLNTADSIFDLASNQYGFGPLFLIKATSIILGTTVIDSIFLCTILVNFFVFALLVFITIRTTTGIKILLMSGFIGSIAITFYISNMMAPLLYHIRYLPTVLICLLLFHSINKDYGISGNKGAALLYLVLLISVALYSFEYALLTAGGITAAGLVSRNKFFTASAFGLGVVAIVFKLILSLFLYSDGNDVPVRYLAYFSEWGAYAIDWRTFIFLGILGFCSYWLIQVKENFEVSSEVLVLYFITLFLTAKVVWNFAANHVGPLFLLIAMVLVSLLLVLRRSTTGSIQERFLESFWGAKFIGFSSLVLIASLLVTPIYLVNDKYEYDTYSETELSSIFKISDGLVDKANSFKNIYTRGDIVISPIDNVLAMFVKTKITRPFADISTNLNFDTDSSLIANYLIKHHTEGRIIVDNYIDTPKHRQALVRAWARIPNRYLIFEDFDKNLFKIASTFELIREHLYQCGANSHFTIYCRIKT